MVQLLGEAGDSVPSVINEGLLRHEVSAHLKDVPCLQDGGGCVSVFVCGAGGGGFLPLTSRVDLVWNFSWLIAQGV